MDELTVDQMPQPVVTVPVPVDSIWKSARGWFNIGVMCVGAVTCFMNLPVIDFYLKRTAMGAGISLFFTGLTNWLLLRQSKKNVISKNVVIIPKEGI